MVKIQTNLNNFSVFDKLSELIKTFENLCGYDLYLDKNGILRPDIDICPKCQSPLFNNGYNKSQNSKAKAFGIQIKKGKVYCSNKSCDFIVSIPQLIFNEWLFCLNDWIISTALSLKFNGLSSEKISKHIIDTCGIKMSSEYIRKKIKEIMGEIETPTLQHKPSEVVIHDEQFVKIKGIDMKRNTILDANNPNVYFDELKPDRKQETIEKSCEKVKSLIGNIYAAVMDGYIGAHNAFIQVFGTILIQFCLFHFVKNVKDAYKDSVGYGKGRAILPLQHLIGFFSILNIFFEHEREINVFRKLQNEMNEHITRINGYIDIPFAQREEWIEDLKDKYDKKALKHLYEIKKARRRVNGIKLKLRTEEQAKKLLEEAIKYNEFPTKVMKQIKRLEKNWTNFTHCMRDKNIPPTSNKVEQYYSLTLNWIDKRNLQSQEEFYEKQKFSLFKRYRIPLIKEGLFSNFLGKTFVMLLCFGFG